MLSAFGQRVKRAFDYKKFYQSWINISRHVEGDSNIQSYIGDTAKYMMQYTDYICFETSGVVAERDTEAVITGENFIVDTIKGSFTTYDDEEGKGAIGTSYFLYLDDKFMLLAHKVNDKTMVDFYISKKVVEHIWKFNAGE